MYALIHLHQDTLATLDYILYYTGLALLSIPTFSFFGWMFYYMRDMKIDYEEDEILARAGHD